MTAPKGYANYEKTSRRQNTVRPKRGRPFVRRQHQMGFWAKRRTTRVQRLKEHNLVLAEKAEKNRLKYQMRSDRESALLIRAQRKSEKINAKATAVRSKALAAEAKREKARGTRLAKDEKRARKQNTAFSRSMVAVYNAPDSPSLNRAIILADKLARDRADRDEVADAIKRSTEGGFNEGAHARGRAIETARQNVAIRAEVVRASGTGPVTTVTESKPSGRFGATSRTVEIHPLPPPPNASNDTRASAAPSGDAPNPTALQSEVSEMLRQSEMKKRKGV